MEWSIAFAIIHFHWLDALGEQEQNMPILKMGIKFVLLLTSGSMAWHKI